MTDINNFWTAFSKAHKEISGEFPSGDAMDHVLECLKKVDPRLYYHLGSKDAVTDLILSAEGYPDLMPASVESKDRKCKISKYDGAKGFSHQVEVTNNILATNQAITDFENYLGSIAMKFGGRNDGWGCFAIKE